MAQIIYALCALTSLACTGLLLRAYLRTKFRLLFWSGLCFAGLTVNNLLLISDRLIFVGSDLLTWRLVAALSALLLLLFGLIWESK
jgi:hypothetical protein